MTAEVAVMNSSGVALAADSAVTVDVGHTKIFRSANKLFTLSKFEPVGIMIYGNAELDSVPWETVIKAYRAELGEQVFDALTEYVDDFFRWLSNHPTLFSREQQDMTFTGVLASWMQFVRQQITSKVDLQAQLGTTQELSPSVLAAEEIALQVERLAGHPKLSGATPARERAIAKRYADTLGTLIDAVFGDIELSPHSLFARLSESPGSSPRGASTRRCVRESCLLGSGARSTCRW